MTQLGGGIELTQTFLRLDWLKIHHALLHIIFRAATGFRQQFVHYSRLNSHHTTHVNIASRSQNACYDFSTDPFACQEAPTTQPTISSGFGTRSLQVTHAPLLPKGQFSFKRVVGLLWWRTTCRSSLPATKVAHYLQTGLKTMIMSLAPPTKCL